MKGFPRSGGLAGRGNDSNHLTWVAGHIVVMRALAPRLLGQEWSAPWQQLFRSGRQAVAPEQYPDAAEIKRAWHEVSGKLSAALENASAEALAQPAPQKEFSLDGKVGGAIALLALHETYHFGQVGYLRK